MNFLRAEFLEDILRADLNDELAHRDHEARVEGLCPEYDGDSYIGARLTNDWQGTFRLPMITVEIQASREARLEWARKGVSSILAQYIDLDVEAQAILRQKAQDQVARRLVLYPKLVDALKTLWDGLDKDSGSSGLSEDIAGGPDNAVVVLDIEVGWLRKIEAALKEVGE